jgi:hypothetical protein
MAQGAMPQMLDVKNQHKEYINWLHKSQIATASESAVWHLWYLIGCLILVQIWTLPSCQWWMFPLAVARCLPSGAAALAVPWLVAPS